MIQPCCEADIPELMSLWQRVFRDEREYIELFFENLYRPGSGYCIRDGGELAAMGFLIPIGTYKGHECRVIYAVACDEKYRGRGYGSLISRTLAGIAGAGGVICPADEGLFDFYSAKAGYKTAFYTCELCYDTASLPKADGEIEKVSPEEYGKLREKYLEAIPHISFNHDAIKHQKAICDYSGGGLFKIRIGDKNGCLAAETWGESIVVKELLGTCGNMECAGLAAGVLPGKKIILRFPAKIGENMRPFAMSTGMQTEKNALPWFGFAFD